jgi:hypothetical protein
LLSALVGQTTLAKQSLVEAEQSVVLTASSLLAVAAAEP